MPAREVVPVVQQHDVARADPREHAPCDRLGVGAPRVVAVQRPRDERQPLAVRGARHRRALHAERRPIQRRRPAAGDRGDRACAAIDLALLLGDREEVLEARVPPGVIAELVARSDHLVGQLRVSGQRSADREEGRARVVLRERPEHERGHLRVRPVVEGERHPSSIARPVRHRRVGEARARARDAVGAQREEDRRGKTQGQRRGAERGGRARADGTAGQGHQVQAGQHSVSLYRAARQNSKKLNH